MHNSHYHKSEDPATEATPQAISLEELLRSRDERSKLQHRLLADNPGMTVVMLTIVMPGTVIKKGATVQYSIVAENSVIEEGATVGRSPEEMSNIEDWGVTVIGNGVTIGKGVSVEPKAMIDTDMGGEK